MSDLLLGAAGDEALVARAKQQLAASSALTVVLETATCLVAVSEGARTISAGRTGIVVGPLFAAGRTAPLEAIAEEDAARILHTRGAALTQGCWGGYVAILVAPGGRDVDLIRAPFGELPCLYAAAAGGWLFGSDARWLERLGAGPFRIDWRALARFLGAPDIRGRETCLAGLEEVRGGDRLTLSGPTASTATLWSPWTFTASDPQLFDAREAAARLRAAVVHAVKARGSLAARSVLLLSGGLDSSIVAASAATAGLDLHGVNLRTRHPSGDEASYARIVGEHTRLPVIERFPQVGNVDLTRSDAASLPRPAVRAFGQELRRQAAAVAKDIGAEQLFTGGGGDNIFCSLQSVAPLVDALRTFDDRREFWRLVPQICELTGASLWTVARRAWLRSLLPRRPPVPELDLSFLSPAAAADARAREPHPWTPAPRRCPPGKAAHVGLLIGPQGLAEDGVMLNGRRLLFPLMTQPLVELCLRIPTWLWFDRGCNRAVARHAFERDLPAAVAWRRSKGSPDSFLVELCEAYRDLIRTMLLEGSLASHGLVDVAAIARFLDDPRPPRGTDHVRILRLVDAEAWSLCWPA